MINQEHRTFNTHANANNAALRSQVIGCDASGGDIRVRPCSEADVAPLAHALAAMDPWARLGIGADQLMAVFADATARGTQRVFLRNESRAATVIVEPAWLFGPYIKSFAVLPDHQGVGVGRAMLDWTVSQVVAPSRNIWVCVSAFNTQAIALYKSAGFVETAELDALVVDTETELLLRRRCDARSADTIETD